MLAGAALWLVTMATAHRSGGRGRGGCWVMSVLSGIRWVAEGGRFSHGYCYCLILRSGMLPPSRVPLELSFLKNSLPLHQARGTQQLHNRYEEPACKHHFNSILIKTVP